MRRNETTQDGTGRSIADSLDDASGAILLGIGVVVGSGLVGGVLGSALPRVTGIETVNALGITFTVSPVPVAAYGVVGVGTFAVTMFGVLEAISRFEES